ncbi:NAD(P)-binding domain-containing protein [Microbacterium chocolatum]|uniref:NAD(P)-binding domain-containing protein n=1 Tax=Microbacterium aurantiacum TaxID=162393 RepID=UPI00339063F2
MVDARYAHPHPSPLPVVVIGAGPQGLAAAAHLTERGVPFLLLEAGAGPASAVAEWEHVRLFSAWPELIDAAAARHLTARGWEAPTSGYPTGAQWISGYLAPLADALSARIRYDARVTGVSRLGRDRLVDAGRGDQPFVVHTVSADGAEERILARAVVDASGTWSSPSPAGADGLPAIGEAAAADLLSYRIPDFRDRIGFEGRHTVVIGSGHSAITAVLALSRMARRDPGTRVTWALRRADAGGAYGGGAGDELPARGALGERARDAVGAGLVDLVTAFRVERIGRDGERAVLIAEDGRTLTADRVVVLTGFRPDLSFLGELRLDLDPTLQAPRRIATEIDPNVHSCGSVAATGAADLAQPEPDFYLVGAKSYGRAPTFLALTGYEQVRSVVAELAGDRAAARRVDLVLPDTGVCGGAGLFDAPAATAEGGGGCCSVPAAAASGVLQIGRAPAQV